MSARKFYNRVEFANTLLSPQDTSSYFPELDNYYRMVAINFGL